MNKIRVIAFATHPIQYQVPIWRSLASSPDLEFLVCFGSDFSCRAHREKDFNTEVRWNVPLLDGYKYIVLDDDPLIQGTDRYFTINGKGVSRLISEFRPDVAIVTAYSPFYWVRVIFGLILAGCPIIYRGEASDVALERTRFKAIIRSLILRALYSRFRRILAIGQRAREHYLAHGVGIDRLGWAPYCVDTAHFEQKVKVRSESRRCLREKFGIKCDAFVYIFSGKLIDKKNPLLIVLALAMRSDVENCNIAVIFVGDGPLMSELKLRTVGIKEVQVVFAGFVNQAEIGAYYAAADCLILPSRFGETWGLVVNEALQFGVPCLVSNKVGCGPDLIQSGRTGYIFESGRHDSLLECMLKIENLMFSQRRSIIENCLLVSELYSAGVAAAGLRDAVIKIGRGK